MFNIRLAQKNDIIKVFELSNENIVRANSINKNKIKWEEHEKWFNERIKNTAEPFFIVEDEKGNFVSQVRFNREGENFIISLSITKEFRGKGLASEIISQCSKKLCSAQIIAYVKPDNTPSKHSFLQAGYEFRGNKTINDEVYEVYLFISTV